MTEQALPFAGWCIEHLTIVSSLSSHSNPSEVGTILTSSLRGQHCS
ncbi:rCG62455 [Rattus norvegicus]|uniref:RCG62455 n=1 Tax=Rattus norvegicus TaxID=10116 RepID=A6J5X9_RAT|nr:rCG62455 [Rattus norvegicus]